MEIPINKLVEMSSRATNEEESKTLIYWYITLNSVFHVYQEHHIQSLPVGNQDNFNQKMEGVKKFFKTFIL